MEHIDRITRFENIARELIEGSFDRVLGRQPVADNIAKELATAIEINQNGSSAPGHYTIYVNPDDYEILTPDLSTLSQQLSEVVSSLARELSLELTDVASVDFKNDSDCKVGRVRVEANIADTEVQSTQAKPVDANNLVAASIKATDAFLIINGKRHITLDKPIISIGRQLNNDIVLDERTVSRLHAQIRWRYGRFILFDLGSSVGTLVNGEPIHECVLHAGDVLRLGSATIIFGKEQFEQTGHQYSREGIKRDEGWTRELIRDAEQDDGEE